MSTTDAHPMPMPKSLAAGESSVAKRVGVPMSEETYLRQESTAREKHEYYEGKAWKMAGGSTVHAAIITDICRVLGNGLDGTTCEIYGSELKITVPDAAGGKRFYYPDASIVCGTPEDDGSGQSLLNPVAIVEVLSESTAAFDRGAKFESYQKIESLTHYILIEQDRVSVTHYEKIAGNLWAIVALMTDLSDTLSLTVADTTATIPLASVYRRVFATDPPTE